MLPLPFDFPDDDVIDYDEFYKICDEFAGYGFRMGYIKTEREQHTYMDFLEWFQTFPDEFRNRLMADDPEMAICIEVDAYSGKRAVSDYIKSKDRESLMYQIATLKAKLDYDHRMMVFWRETAERERSRKNA